MDWDGDGDWNFGWIFPAFLIGKLIADAFDRRAPAPPPLPRLPTLEARTPEPAAAPVKSAPATCQHCGTTSEARFAFCPHCGHKLSPAACRYCGQHLQPELRFCGQCGGPRR